MAAERNGARRLESGVIALILALGEACGQRIGGKVLGRSRRENPVETRETTGARRPFVGGLLTRGVLIR